MGKKQPARTFGFMRAYLPLVFAGIFLASVGYLNYSAYSDHQRQAAIDSSFRTFVDESRSAANIEAFARAYPIALYGHLPQTEKAGLGGRPTSTTAQMSAPSLGSTLSGSDVTFNWNPGTEISPYWLYLGNSRAASDVIINNQRIPGTVSPEGYAYNSWMISVAEAYESTLSEWVQVYTVNGEFVPSVPAAWVELNTEDPYTSYVYQRLALEDQRNRHQIESSSYDIELSSLARSYLQQVASNQPMSSSFSASELNRAKGEIDELQNQVASLKLELAQTQKSTVERWLPIIVAVLSFLLALSANLIQWRGERRQVREAQLFELRRKQLEQSVAQTAYQIERANSLVIVPNEHEIRLYTRHNSSNISSSM